MTSDEFIQTLRCGMYVAHKRIEIEKIILHIDELRKIHQKMQSKLEYLFVDPNEFEKQETKQEINARAIEIIEFCKQVDITCSFFKIPIEYTDFTKQFKQEKQFVKYYFQSLNITNLIVFTKREKQKPGNKNEVNLSEIQFTDEIQFPDEIERVEPQLKIYDEHGNDLNAFEKI